MPAVLSVATAQSRIDADIGRNGATVRALMRRAQRAGARLVHFPEGALSGYARSEIATWRDFDFAAVERELAAIAALAARLGIWVVVGGAHRLSPPHRPHNSLYVIADDGRIATRYDKRFCSHNETANWYTPGFDPCVFDVDGIRFACALCIEIQFPEIFTEAAAAGAQCMLFSAYSADPMFAIQAQGHAATCNLWVSLSGPVNTSRGLPAALIGPDGRVVARCRRGGSALIVNAIDPGDPAWEIPIRRARPWRAAARAGDIYAARRVDDPRSADKSCL